MGHELPDSTSVPLAESNALCRSLRITALLCVVDRVWLKEVVLDCEDLCRGNLTGM